MDIMLKILVLSASEKVPQLMHQVVVQQAHPELLLTTREGGHLELLEMSTCCMRGRGSL